MTYLKEHEMDQYLSLSLMPLSCQSQIDKLVVYFEALEAACIKCRVTLHSLRPTAYAGACCQVRLKFHPRGQWQRGF